MRLRSEISAPGGWLYRIAPSAVVALVFCGFALLWSMAPDIYLAVLSHAGFQPLPQPLADTRSVTQAISCWQAGVNVYVPSHCMGGGVYNYSPFLLHLGALFPVPRDNFSVGIGLDILFIVSFCWLPPAQTRAELLWRIAAACSGSVLFVLERANIDTAMFVLTVLGIVLIRINCVIRIAGYLAFLLGAACKFYPVVLLLLVWRERPRWLLLLALPGFLALVCYIIIFGRESLAALSIVPSGLPFTNVFGALNWSFGLALLRFLPVLTMEPSGPQYLAAIHQPHVMAYIILSTRLLMVLGVYAAWRLRPVYAAPLQAMPEAEALFLAAACLLIGFCFFMAQNIDYRAIFLLLTLPGLQYLARTGGGHWLLAALLLLMWEGALRQAIALLSTVLFGASAPYVQAFVWLLREITWWLVTVRLTAIAMAYLHAALSTLLTGATISIHPLRAAD